MLEKIQQEPGKTQSNQGRKKETNAKPRQTKPNQTELTIEPNSNRFW